MEHKIQITLFLNRFATWVVSFYNYTPSSSHIANTLLFTCVMVGFTDFEYHKLTE